MKPSEQTMGLAVQNMVSACRLYAGSYQRNFGAPIGDDHVLGDALADILRGVHELLNGPLGREDGGDLSAKIYKLARECELLDENGEIRCSE